MSMMILVARTIKAIIRIWGHPSFDPKSSLHFFANLNLDKPIVMEKSCDFAIISPTGEAIEKEELTKDLLD